MASTRPFLQAALNGARPADASPHLPTTPDDLAREAAEAVAAGADAVHLHVRGADRRESLRADDVARTLAAVRAACPGTPVGISTGFWITRSHPARMELVRAWEGFPDYVSVNFDEEGAAELAEHLLARGVALEAGVADAGGVRTLAASGLGGRCLRILIEPREQDVAEAEAVLRGVYAALDDAGIGAVRMMHGLDAAAWPLLASAARAGLAMRIGMEDVLLLPDGTPAPGNGALVAAARRIIEQAAPRT
jgi:uncharacterized protein (DUF849 family)